MFNNDDETKVVMSIPANITNCYNYRLFHILNIRREKQNLKTNYIAISIYNIKYIYYLAIQVIIT